VYLKEYEQVLEVIKHFSSPKDLDQPPKLNLQENKASPHAWGRSAIGTIAPWPLGIHLSSHVIFS